MNKIHKYIQHNHFLWLLLHRYTIQVSFYASAWFIVCFLNVFSKELFYIQIHCTGFLQLANKTCSHWPEAQSPVQVAWWTVPSHDRTVGTQTLSCPEEQNQRMPSDCFCIMLSVFSMGRDSLAWSECIYLNNWQIVYSLWSAGAECLWWCCRTSWCLHGSENTVGQLALGVRLQKSPSLFLEK